MLCVAAALAEWKPPEKADDALMGNVELGERVGGQKLNVDLEDLIELESDVLLDKDGEASDLACDAIDLGRSVGKR